MAYELNFWEADGPDGEACIKTVRIARIQEKEEVMKQNMFWPNLVRVTLDRTSNNKIPTKTLWIKPGYVDPFGQCFV